MNNTIKRTWNQGSMVNIEDLRGMTFQAESGGHTFVISAVDADGNAVAMSGTPAGTMLRPDNTDQALTCSISGGNVYATLPAGCYDVPGRAGITIFLTSGGQKAAIYAAVVSVTRTQSGTASPGTTASVVDLVNAINTAISGIPATDTALKAAMAPTYSNSALYAVGEYAWYNGTLYRCTTAITTAETWTSGHWTTAAIGTDSANELRGLKSAFDFESVFGSINLIRPFKKPSGTERGVTFSWNGSKVTITGTSTQSSGWVLYQDKANLPEGIEAGKSYHVKFSSTDIIFRVYAYDANEESTQILSTKEDTELVIPNNAVGISFRLYQVANKTFNETVYAPVVYADYDNIELRKEIDVLNAISNQEAIALFRNKGDVPTFIDDGNNLKVKVPAQLRVIGNIYGDGTIGNQAAEYTLEPSKFLTVNLLLETLSVKSYSEILPEDVILIGLTSASGVIGQWAPYYYINKTKDSANKRAYALFRDKNKLPEFSYDSSNNLKIKIPPQLRVINSEYGDGTIGSQAAEYTLEPSKYLTVNMLLETISVKSYSEILSEDVVLIGLTAASGVIGQWAPYYYIQKIKDDFSKKDIPDYYFEDNYLPDKVDTINEIAVGLGIRGFQTFFITGYHAGYNARNSVPLIQYLVKNTGIHNVSFGGDGITHDYTSKNAGYSLLCEFLNDFKGIEDVANVYYITGNHEMNDADGNNSSSRLSQQTPYRLFNGRMQGKVYNLYGTVMAYSMNGTSYNYTCNETNAFYVDFNAEKIRCIYVDTLFNSKISEDSVVAAFSALETVPDGYAVLIVSHRAVATTGKVSEGTFRITGVYERFGYIMQAAKAMNDGSEVTVDAAFTYDVVEHHNYHFDFTGKQRQFIGVLCGHVHYDGYYIYDNRFPVILTTCDCIDNAAGVPAYRISGKVSEQAFDVVQINIDTETPANNRIYLTRIGWGEDREFSFGVQGAGLIE